MDIGRDGESRCRRCQDQERQKGGHRIDDDEGQEGEEGKSVGRDRGVPGRGGNAKRYAFSSSSVSSSRYSVVPPPNTASAQFRLLAPGSTGCRVLHWARSSDQEDARKTKDERKVIIIFREPLSRFYAMPITLVSRISA